MPLNYKIKISNQLKLKKITNIPCSQENNRTEKRNESWTHGDCQERGEKILQLLVKKFQKRVRKTLTTNYNQNYDKLKKKIEDYLEIDGLGLQSKRKNDREGSGVGKCSCCQKGTIDGFKVIFQGRMRDIW